jgi:hypothetical protein
MTGLVEKLGRGDARVAPVPNQDTRGVEDFLGRQW